MYSHANTKAYFHFHCSLIPSTKPWIFLVFIPFCCLNRRCILRYFFVYFVSLLTMPSFSHLFFIFIFCLFFRSHSKFAFTICLPSCLWCFPPPPLSGIVSIIYMVLASTIFHIDCVCMCTGMCLSLSYISYWFTDPVEVALVIHRIILCLYLATIYWIMW